MTTKKRVPAIEGWFTLDDAAPRLLGSRCKACGAVFFPRPPSGPNPPIEELCSVLTDIDFAPRRNNADNILRVFQSTGPSGGTPTFLGLQLVRNWFEAQVESTKVALVPDAAGVPVSWSVPAPVGVTSIR